MKVLVLTDLKIGSSKQAIALGNELSNEVMIYEVKYNCFIKIRKKSIYKKKQNVKINQLK
jgi:mitochondrial fission protein ELM1